jgi:hypothetical protein
MLPDALFSEPGLAEPERPHRRLPAITTSVLLHAALVFALVRVAPTVPPPANDASAKPAVVVSIATRSPQRRSAPPAPVAIVEPEAATADAPALSEPVDDPADSAPPENPVAPTTVTDTEAAEETTSGAQPAIVLDRTRLQNSISGHVANYKQDLLDQTSQECQQYRDRYARWDCPQEDEVKTATQARIDENLDLTFRDWVYGYDANARISRELVAEQSRLQPLMEDQGVLGALARERHALIREQYIFLNPVPEEEGTIRLVTFGLGGITILNRLQIGLDGEIKSGNEVRGPAPHLDDADD